MGNEDGLQRHVCLLVHPIDNSIRIGHEEWWIDQGRGFVSYDEGRDARKSLIA